MTQLLQTPKIEYLGDGVTTTFAFVFTSVYDSTIQVIVDETQLQENIDYTLENITEFGGEVEFFVAPVDQSAITIQRFTPLVQQVDLEPFSEFPADTIEWSYDRIIRILQEFSAGVQDTGTNPPQFVLSVFGRIGHITAFSGDYQAFQITFDPTASGLSAIEVQAAINEVVANFNAHAADANAHHPQLHNLESHTNVAFTNEVAGQSLLLSEDGITWVNRVARAETWATGLGDGGELNIAPGINDVEVIAGVGIIVDNYTVPLSAPVVQVIAWDTASIAITALPSVAGSIVFFTMSDTGVPSTPIGNNPVNVGVLKQYAQRPNPTLSRQEIPLGFAVHNGVSWQEVSNPKVVNQTAETLREVATDVLPFSSIIEGGEISEQAAFTLNQASGVIWENNRSWHVSKSDPNREALPASAPIIFQYVNRDFTDVGALISTVEPNMYDNNGTVEAIGGNANNTTIQRLYLDPADRYWILWGQEIYPTFLTAQANLLSEVPVVPDLLQSSLLLGYIIAERAKTDWDIDEAIFISAGGSLSGGGGGTPITDHDNLNGITANNHHNQVHLLYGADHSDVDTTTVLENGSSLVYSTGSNKWFGLNINTQAGYGGVTQTPAVGIPDLGIWFDVLPANAGVISVPRFLTQDFANDGLVLDIEGIWNVSISFSLVHNESNSGRQIVVQLYNSTTATVVGDVVLPIARNQPGTYFSVSILAEVANANIGDLFVVRVGGGDAVTAVTLQRYTFSANHVSEWKG